MALRNTSEYNKLKNSLNKRKGKIINVYVENELDIPFWKNIFEKNKIQTKIFPASHDNTRGKSEVLKKINDAGEYLLLCVDSDLDYLLNQETKKSKEISENPFIFQTYTYSIENYKCYAPSLHQITIEATNCDNNTFDFEDFLAKYSQKIYELFVYFFYYDKKQEIEMDNFLENCKIQGQKFRDKNDFYVWKAENQPKNDFALDILNQITGFKNQKFTSVQDITGYLEILENKCNEKIKNTPSISQKELNNLKKNLKKQGLKPENTYLFVQGHNLYDNVILKILEPICDYLKNEKKEEFEKNSKDEKEFNLMKGMYFNALPQLKSILSTNKNFEDCFLFKKIQKDIKSYKVTYP